MKTASSAIQPGINSGMVTRVTMGSDGYLRRYRSSKEIYRTVKSSDECCSSVCLFMPDCLDWEFGLGGYIEGTQCVSRILTAISS